MHFEWDESKNASNKQKHGISFELACLAFQDPFLLSLLDDRINHEERWQSIGMVGDQTIIFVAHTVREEDDHEETIRIISARKATPSERKFYLDERRAAR